MQTSFLCTGTPDILVSRHAMTRQFWGTETSFTPYSHLMSDSTHLKVAMIYLIDTKRYAQHFPQLWAAVELLLRYLYGQEGCSTLWWLIIVGAGAQCWEMLTPFCHAYGWKRHTRKWNNTTAEGTRVPVREESHVRKWEPIWEQCRISRNISKISSSVESAGM